MLQEFDLEIKDKKGVENVVADHLSRLNSTTSITISTNFPDEYILFAQGKALPWYAHIVNYLLKSLTPQDWLYQKKKNFVHEFRYFIWYDRELCRLGADHILRRCIPQEEQQAILEHCHTKLGGGHYSAKIKGHKVFECGFY